MLPPSRPVPFRPTVTVTVHVPVAAPQENVALGEVGLAIVPQLEVHWSVGVPPLPPAVDAVSDAVSGGSTSPGLTARPVMAGHTNGDWFTSETPASTAMLPLSTKDGSDASVGTVHVTITTAGVVAPGATETGNDEPSQKSPLVSVPDRVTT